MKRIVLLLLLIFGIYNINIKSQKTVVVENLYDNNDITDITAFNTTNESGIVINYDMIERFNNVNTDGEYLTWRDLILGYDIQSLRDFYYAYINCNFEKESLSDIKLALEDKKLIQEYNEEHIAKVENKRIEKNVTSSLNAIVQRVE